MGCSETKGIIVPIFFLDVQYPVFQCGNEIMLATAYIQEAFFLHNYITYFHMFKSLPPFLYSKLFSSVGASYFLR
jgi:hypothetical protein